MKTHKNLYSGITSFDNLLLAARKAQRGKRFKESTAVFNLNLERELLCIQKELQEMTYRHGGYQDFYVYDPKRRLISAAPYRDRIVHHALCNVIEPIFDRIFIYDTYACRKRKGVHAAVDRYNEYARKYTYVLKCDIRKYFQSVDHEILLEMISRKIACPQTMWLITKIIASRDDKSHVSYFENDTLFTPFERKRGIPIGNLTSQFFANVYLNGFDHFVKEILGQPYIRYVDDFVVFGNSKGRLHEVNEKIQAYLSSLRLNIHERKCRIYRVKDGITFLGYRIFPTHRLLKKDNVLRMRRRLKKLSRKYSSGMVSLPAIKLRIQSWIGHAGHADTFRLRARMLADAVFQRGETRGAAGRLVEQQP
ncbi:group II intron reverse transcriptase domain-containing protein [Candidatus Poribacteria bacterium]|nr:group II intron reverse transcriptase domain-containing protein [Candidatus Poribacteria bacterium]